jgi:hypothetical protein
MEVGPPRSSNLAKRSGKASIKLFLVSKKDEREAGDGRGLGDSRPTGMHFGAEFSKALSRQKRQLIASAVLFQCAIPAAFPPRAGRFSPRKAAPLSWSFEPMVRRRRTGPIESS